MTTAARLIKTPTATIIVTSELLYLHYCTYCIGRHGEARHSCGIYKMTLNDRTDFERSPKPNGTPIFCPQQILENSFPPVKHPKRARLWGVGFGAILGYYRM